MRKILIVLLACVVLSSCATTPSAGSRRWYDNRMMEIEQLKRDGKISEKEYVELKNQTDGIRSERKSAVVAGVLAGRN